MTPRGERLCTKVTKVRFKDRLACLMVLARRQHADKGERRCYLCPHCKGWHLTSERSRT